MNTCLSERRKTFVSVRVFLGSCNFVDMRFHLMLYQSTKRTNENEKHKGSLIAQPITERNAGKKASICGLVPIVTRKKFGIAGKTRPTCTLRSRSALMIGRTSRRKFTIRKFA